MDTSAAVPIASPQLIDKKNIKSLVVSDSQKALCEQRYCAFQTREEKLPIN